MTEGRGVAGSLAVCTLLALAPALLLVLQVMLTVPGFVYSLDDPYIHLALGRQILQGHYGLNPGEFSAPASSIFWPFLLAPFASTRIAEAVPLVIDLAALTVTLWWIGRWLETYMTRAWALSATVVLALCLNLYGLPITGMEHSVQVMFAAIVVLSLVQDRILWPFWVSVLLLPFIRYEGLALSLPTLAFLFLTGRHRAATVIASIAILAGVAGFSAFLYAHSGNPMPASIMAKQGLTFADRLPTFHSIAVNVRAQLFFCVIAAFAGFLYLREGKLLLAVLLVAVPTIGQMIFGQYGSMERYQIYFDMWIGALFVGAYMRSTLPRSTVLNILLLAGLAWGSRGTIPNQLVTSLASRNNHDQQDQMATIAGRYLAEPVAANDIGLIAFRAKVYVLDLWGLASYEALRLRGGRHPETWMEDLMRRHKVEHAFFYDTWFGEHPASWIRVATLTLPAPSVVAGGSQVSLYSTNPEAAARLRAALTAYRQSSLQAAMMLTLTPLS